MKRIFLILSLSLLLLPVYAADPGTASAAFLKIVPDARYVAMGEAGVALATDANATYWNPAGLGLLGKDESPKADIAFSHNEWLDDIRIEYLAGAYRLGEIGTFGLAATYLTMGDIQGYDEQGNPTSMFTSSDMVGNLSYGREIVYGISGGITLKYLQQKIENESADTFTGGAGLRYDPDWAKGLSIAASGSELFGEAKFVSEADPMPQIIRSGIAYMLPINQMNRITAAVDYVQAVDMTGRVNTGVEYVWNDLLALRVGYKAGYDLFGLTAGLGLTHSFGALRARLDYGFGASNEFGDVHRISAGVGF